MKAQEYTIKAVKKSSTWKNSYGEFQNYGLALIGFGEPVKISRAVNTLMTDPAVGEVLFGSLVEETSVEGKIYYKLQEEPRPPQDRRELSISAQSGIKNAINIWIAQGCNPDAYENIEAEAVHFARMINRVKEEIS